MGKVTAAMAATEEKEMAVIQDETQTPKTGFPVQAAILHQTAVPPTVKEHSLVQTIPPAVQA